MLVEMYLGGYSTLSLTSSPELILIKCVLNFFNFFTSLKYGLSFFLWEIALSVMMIEPLLVRELK